ncbi:hypothetical protein A3D00_04175 [Candidatus Woesebacteria bacterium RIFCSPHIGHO2_02_FULL_38_9]|uniref:Antitoxin n=1 Tax=Candidatus Woesebacteria bacterium RIFCSPHIGHO2_01_FULL_39_28 TaxID=1802496 RepID=A0A1F7YET4_9BACT|nr:MAG: hypothetical protein A2627_05105 [Candidatus Woesebacteria bacterium RIFCSPHIGHO2_01_FULL_39_28]OGM33761.1 MAG: hypothetical protein A3D00_04175 [Candidatus Woesebacteria bacterium RIFCSPHIGHO2_02_FULL_38_9]OGM57571.1 MAG: hypothetical protein A3A50_06220 [Candidatus Woesebacteria bacterium RIFCSPLOWO2_01_FULL_38_20]
MRVISAYQARTNFGELLNLVYYKDEEVVIERKGKPMVKITKMKTAKKKTADPFLRAAGAWKDLDTNKMISEIYKARSDGSKKKKFLASWNLR